MKKHEAALFDALLASRRAKSEEEKLKENTYYKRSYEAALQLLDCGGPPWEELTHEQRVAVREECIRYAKELDDFGASLRETVK
jgi:hypothetical protein